MSDPVSTLLIQIRADATQALQALKSIATGTTQVSQAAVAANVSAATVSTSLTQAGQEAEKASGHIRGLTYYFRSGMDSMRFALLGGGNPMAAFYAADEGIRAMVASGMEIGTLVPVIGGVAAAIGAVVFGFHEWNEGQREAAQKTKELAEAWKQLPDLIKQVNDLQNTGMLSPAAASEYRDYLTGRKKLYVDENGNITRDATRTVREPVMSQYDPMGPSVYSGMQSVTQNNAEASQDQIAKWYHDQVIVPQQALDLLKKAKEETRALYEEGLQGIAKEKAELHDKYEKERQDAQETLEALQSNLGPAKFGASADVKALAEQIKQSTISEANDMAALDAEYAKKKQQALEEAQRQQQEKLRQQDEQKQKQQEADKQHEQELQRQAQLQRDIQRSDLEDQIEYVKSNALLTDQTKLQVVTALQAQQIKINDAEILELENLKSQVKSLSDQLELEKKIAELKHDNNRLQEQPTADQQNSFGFQFGKSFVDIQNKWAGWAAESAKAFQSSWLGATNGVSAGLTHLFEYGAQKGQWFREMWNGVVGSLISSFTQMAVSWVMNHVLMEAVGIAFYAIMRELGMADVAAKILGDNMKLISHIYGETTATTVTTTQATTRIAAHAAAAGAGAAESVASIPFVGWVLAIGVAAAIIGGILALARGFKGGGYTGDGDTNEVAGVVHKGEFVVPASRVNSSTISLLHAIRNGSFADSMAPMAGAGTLTAPSGQTRSSGQNDSQTNIHNAVYFNKQDMIHALEQSDAHEKYIVDVMARNIHKFQS